MDAFFTLNCCVLVLADFVITGAPPLGLFSMMFRLNTGYLQPAAYQLYFVIVKSFVPHIFTCIPFLTDLIRMASS